MPGPDLPPLSDVQHEIMSVVWENGPCSSSEVWKVLHAARGVSRNTVHTLLVRLEEKGWLSRHTDDGNVLFSATVTRDAAQQQSVRHLINTVFDGSAEDLVLTLLNHRTVSAAEANRIRKLISKAGGQQP